MTPIMAVGAFDEKNPSPIIGITIACDRNQRIRPYTTPLSQGAPGSAGYSAYA